jgi:transposase
LSHSCPRELISRDEIRAVYARGEEAVIELVEGLVEKLGKLEERVEALEGKDKKIAAIAVSHHQGMGLGKRPKVYEPRARRKQVDR